MRFIKKYNEEVKFEHEWDPECDRLQKEINKYNDILINDEVWKNFYHRIPLYYQKQLDSDFLESIIEFGKKRIEDIMKEKEELLQDVKDIFQDVEDETNFIKEIEYELRRSNDISLFQLSIHIFLNEDVEDLVYVGILPYYTQFAVENIWTNISMITKRLKTLNLDCKVNWTVSKKINLILKLN